VIGAVLAAGTIGFDNALALNLESHLPAGVSVALSGAGSALTSELAKLPGASALGGASLVPMDKAGRAIVYLLVGGTLTKPTFAVDTKRMMAEATGGAKNALNDALQKKKDELKAQALAEKAKLEAQAMQKADSVKAKAQAAVDEQKKKAEAAAEEQKQKAEAAAEEQKKKAAEGAKKEGKKVLKGLGF
jgi:colicin import membrane protein